MARLDDGMERRRRSHLIRVEAAPCFRHPAHTWASAFQRLGNRTRPVRRGDQLPVGAQHVRDVRFVFNTAYDFKNASPANRTISSAKGEQNASC